MDDNKGMKGNAVGSKWANLAVLSAATLLSMTLWFSASAVVPQLTLEWGLDGAGKAWMTMSLQLGFVAGTLLSAFLNLPDRYSCKKLFALSAFVAAVVNLGIALPAVGYEEASALRFLTGVCLAGVYPPGMKLVATWCRRDLGLGIGLLVGAMTFGSAAPHLFNALPVFGEGGMPPWRTVILAASVLAFISVAVMALFFKPGPYLSETAPFDIHYIKKALSDKPTRLANFGYLGHMWELFAMWTWAPILLIESYHRAGLAVSYARHAGFAVIAIGAAGCVLAGYYADRIGRTKITVWSLAVSGLCAVTVGMFFNDPYLLTALCLLWGFAVVADSAQFSATVSELTDRRYVGTALTLQTALGFLLTLVTIRLVPFLADNFGWESAFIVLGIGPVFGIVSMLALRNLPESLKIASGNR